MAVLKRAGLSLAIAVSFALPAGGLHATRAEAASLVEVLLGKSQRSSPPPGVVSRSQREQQSVKRTTRQKREAAGEGVAQKKKRKQRAEATETAADAGSTISAPTYYVYKADAQKPVDLSVLPGPALVASVEVVASDAPVLKASVSRSMEGTVLAEEPIVQALADFYRPRASFVWVNGGLVNARAGEAMRVLAEADGYGLNPADYLVPLPDFAAGGDERTRHAELVRFELGLSARLLRYVRDASGGRIDPNRLSGYHDFPAKPLSYVSMMGALAGAPDLRAFLEGRHPANADYAALRAELSKLQREAAHPVTLNANVLLRPGMTSADLPGILHELSARVDDEAGAEHKALLDKHAGEQTYAAELVPAVRYVQKAIGVRSDGIIGPRTVQALVGPPTGDRIEKLVLALEQMRWLPSDLGSRRVFINQPAFTAAYIEDNAEKLKMRVVVGTKGTQTSFFYDQIEQVDYNPYWGVPQSIIVNEMLPRLRRDPGYLDRAGYEVTDARGKRIRSSSVNWGKYGAKVPYDIRQVPSERNALGELKILFPNKHAIYMHDTPSKGLFQTEMRAYSHGCVRLQDPRAMAAAVLGKPVDYVAGKLAQGHSIEKVPVQIPVYVAYFTAWPDADGRIEYFADVYDRDKSLKTAIAATDSERQPRS